MAEGISATIIHFSAGQVAKVSGRSKESAKAWKNASRTPNSSSLINLARTLPSVKAWLLQQLEVRVEPVATDANSVMAVFQRLSAEPGPEGDVARAVMNAFRAGAQK